MWPVIYILGIVTGIILTAVLLFIDLLIHRKVSTQGIRGILQETAAGKAEIIESQEGELSSWLDELPNK